MDDVFGRQFVALGDFGFAGGAAAERFALGQQFAPRRAVDGPVHAAAAQERSVGGVDDGVHSELGDVAFLKVEALGEVFGHGSSPRIVASRGRLKICAYCIMSKATKSSSLSLGVKPATN
ncbi:MAG: hypothetical protein L0Y72_16330 [Gemmataceae bacterium]|nr:hypothetical protein [Gemmataceae bacterium]MCI0740616.1 hypothetical protein [Gemmataceae bacterium]